MSERYERPQAVLFDRDGTLVRDVPYNGDPARVEIMPTVAASVRALREASIPIGVVSNQSGIGRGIVRSGQVLAVNRRIEEMLGRFDVWRMCPHVEEDGCECRKPRPGMILDACSALDIAPRDIAVIGDIGADIAAASAAGARSVLVPTAQTLANEVERAPLVAATVGAALALLFPTEMSRR